jgi:hypothetical protein
MKPMAKRSAINEGDEPAELNIGLDKIQDIVLKARAFDFKDFPDEPDPGAEVDAGQDREERLDQGDDPTEAALRELIDDLNDDEIVDLIALVWIGRGTGTGAGASPEALIELPHGHSHACRISRGRALCRWV